MKSFLERNNLLFSTHPDPKKSKTKCVFIKGKKKNLLPPANLQLYGVDLPWVETATHLGHEFTSEATMDTDSRMKRAAFISRSIEVRETFGFAKPAEILSAVLLYCCDFYGSMLWDFRSETTNMFFRSWRTRVKLAYMVPRWTKTFLVDHLLAVDLVSAKEEVLARFTGFVEKLAISPCREVRVLGSLIRHDSRSVTGSNVALIECESGLEVGKAPIQQFRAGLVAARPEVPSADFWRLPYLKRLLEDRTTSYINPEGDEEEKEAKAWRKRREELIESLCA